MRFMGALLVGRPWGMLSDAKGALTVTIENAHSVYSTL